MTINDRIQKLVDTLYNGNVSAFGRAINVKQATLNTILSGRKSKPSFEVLASIVNARALNVSADWLLTGEGEIFVDGEPGPTPPKDPLTNFILKDNQDLRKRVEVLIDEKARLEEQLIQQKKKDAQEGEDVGCADVKPLAG